MSTPWLQPSVFDSYFGTRDIWGRDRASLARDTPQPQNVAPDQSGRGLAYAFAWQLQSRITTQPLGFRSGDEAKALDSIFSLFAFARERVESAGPPAAQTAEIIWWMLNRDVRPFTARWHRAKEKGLLAVEDVARRFRAELETLRSALVNWARLLRVVSAGPAGNVASLEPLSIPQPSATPMTPRKAPCAQDGMVAPTPNDDAFTKMVAAEEESIQQWRAATGREKDALCGIALSGGGIRSATFCLGVLRQLALHIDVFGTDYISTVSGGGYLGTLIAMAYGSGICAENRKRGPLGRDAGRDIGAEVVAWLRSRGRAIQADGAFIASIAGGLIGIENKDAASEYRRRLREGWILTEKPRENGLGKMVLGSDKDSPSTKALTAVAPLQLWNMALNATNPGPQLGVALRGRTCDLYTVSRVGAESRLLGYAEKQAMAVDAAMAISAAACAPTTDEDTSSWVLRIASLAGANLGRWVDHTSGASHAPSWTDRLLSLLGKSEASEGSAFLSDGGHIENLGLYQLLRRRCACILAIDGEEDPKMTFSSLMKLQHLVRVEQGITLDIDVTDLATDQHGKSDSHFTMIPIEYPKLPLPNGTTVPAERGSLVYVKLSLTGDEPQYLRAYKADHPEFPHHSTVRQQSFDDRMFEAYLALGEHVGAQLVSKTWCGKEPETAFSAWITQLAARFADA
jgi:hypothetical protein